MGLPEFSPRGKGGTLRFKETVENENRVAFLVTPMGLAYSSYQLHLSVLALQPDQTTWYSLNTPGRLQFLLCALVQGLP